MARTQASGAEILDGSVAVVDLADDIVPYMRQRSKPSDRILTGEHINIMQNRQHIVVTEILVEGEITLDGTLGIL